MYRLKISILGMSETRWKEVKEVRSDNVYIVQSGNNNGRME